MKKSLTLGVIFVSSLVLAACGSGNTKKIALAIKLRQSLNLRRKNTTLKMMN
ncbi:hypothetical protein V6R94_02910 [Pediococcus acidilactici]